MLSAQKVSESAGAFLLLINEAIDVLLDLFDSQGGGKAPFRPTALGGNSS